MPFATSTMTNTGLVVRVWNDAAIARRDEDGYANATAMCQANGKLWGHYKELSRTQEYIQALSASLDLPADQLVITTTTGPNEFRGTWIHPRLAVDLARWISPAFAVWMDGWFLESISQSPKPSQLPSPFGEEHLNEGVKVFAVSERDAVDIWRETLHKQLISLVNSSFATAHRTYVPPLTHCHYVKIKPHFSREILLKVIPANQGFTTHELLAKLGHPITRANEMHISAALRAMGYVKGRIYCNGRQPYVWRNGGEVWSIA